VQDKTLQKIISKEINRQKTCLNLIASENYPSPEVRKACGSVLMNKYSEGYPGARYYSGNENIDLAEKLAQKRARKLFELNEKIWEVNVQPYSGTPANLAVYSAILKNKNDVALAMDLSGGGHLSHGYKLSISARFFNFKHYGVDKNGFIDYKNLEKLALKYRPKLIISGASAYPRKIDYKKFKQVAERVKALHLSDISHIAGLIAGKVLPSPFPYCDIVTTTTHKTLRGPRGAIIFMRKKWAKEINKAVFPGFQGGPHDQQTAAIAVALKEAQQKNFKKYAYQVIKNAKVLAKELKKYQFRLITDGTDNHLILIDLRNLNISGKEAEEMLYRTKISVNRNIIPNDTNPPYRPSGIRIGTPAITTLGLKEKEMKIIADWIKKILFREENPEKIKKEVLGLLKTRAALKFFE